MDFSKKVFEKIIAKHNLGLIYPKALNLLVKV